MKKILISLVLLVVLAYFFITKTSKGKEVKEKLKEGKEKLFAHNLTPEEKWKAAPGMEVQDLLSWKGETIKVRVKEYDRTSHALLPNGTVLHWVNIEFGFTAPGYWTSISPSKANLL